MKVDLSKRALLKVSGEGAEQFLQNQLSNDVTLLTDNAVQLNAFCTHQGRIVALFRTFKIGSDYFLDFPNALLAVVEKRLKMFVLMAKVVIAEVSNDYLRIGLIDEDKPANCDGYLNITANCYLAVFAKHNHTVKTDDFADGNIWQLAMIEQGLPEVELATTELFIPQMLNLDLAEVNGVSFKKGCYPGQEVVARLHYLGKAKRRMVKLKAPAQRPKAGDVLFFHHSQSSQKSGIIVSVANVEQGSVCLAMMDLSKTDQAIYLNDEQGEKLEIIND